MYVWFIPKGFDCAWEEDWDVIIPPGRIVFVDFCENVLEGGPPTTGVVAVCKCFCDDFGVSMREFNLEEGPVRGFAGVFSTSVVSLDLFVESDMECRVLGITKTIQRTHAPEISKEINQRNKVARVSIYCYQSGQKCVVP